VRVEPAVVGEPADGYIIGDITARPPIMRVKGPRTRVDMVRTLRTVPVNIAGQTADVVAELNVLAPEGVSILDKPNAAVTVQVVPANADTGKKAPQ
jgi:YbbR domain-containing protein